MVHLQVRRHSLRTEAALVHGKVVARFEPDNMVLLDQKIYAALHSTIRAVSRHDAVNHTVGTPAVVRSIVQVRTELFYDFL